MADKKPIGDCSINNNRSLLRYQTKKIITGNAFKEDKGKDHNFIFFTCDESQVSQYQANFVKKGLNVAFNIKRCKNKVSRLKKDGIYFYPMANDNVYTSWNKNYYWEIEIPDDASILYTTMNGKLLNVHTDKLILKNPKRIWENEEITLKFLKNHPHDFRKTTLRTQAIIDMALVDSTNIRYLEKKYVTNKMIINAIKHSASIIDTVPNPSHEMIIELCKTLNFSDVWFYDDDNQLENMPVYKRIIKNEFYRTLIIMCNNRDMTMPRFFNDMAVRMKIERSLTIHNPFNTRRYGYWSGRDTLNFIFVPEHMYRKGRIYSGRTVHRIRGFRNGNGNGNKKKKIKIILPHEHLKQTVFAVGCIYLANTEDIIKEIIYTIKEDPRLIKYINKTIFSNFMKKDFVSLRVQCKREKLWTKELQTDFESITKTRVDELNRNNEKDKKKKKEKKVTSLKGIKNPSKSTLKAYVRSDYRKLNMVKKQTEDICLSAVSKFPGSLCYVKNVTMKILKESMKNDGTVFSKVLNPTEEMQLFAVGVNGMHIQNIENPSKKVINKAIKQNPMAIQHVENPSLAIQYMALKLSIWAIKYVDHIKIMEKYGKTYNDKLKMLKANGSLIFLMDKPDQKMMLTAVKSDGFAIKFIEYPSEELCVEAVKQNPLSMIYMNIFQSERVCEEAFKKNKSTIFLFKKEYREKFLKLDTD